MPNSTLTSLPSATTLSGGESLYGVQVGASVQITANQIAALANPFGAATTVAALPSASSAGAGTRGFVTDANSSIFLSVVAGGGTNKVPVVSDGTNWLIG